MDTMPWRERVALDDALLAQFEVVVSALAKHRATALDEGVAELGSVYAVAKDLGKSWNAVDKAIKKAKKKGTATAAPTTE